MGLKKVFAGLVERHPYLVYAAKRRLLPLRAPVMRRRRDASSDVTLGLWYEEQSSGELKAEGATAVPDAAALQLRLLNRGAETFGGPGFCGVRGDLVELARGGFLFVLTWRHSQLDGVGVELLLRDIDAASRADVTALVDIDPELRAAKKMGFTKRWRATIPIVKKFYRLMEKPFHSLGGRNPKPGGTRFEVFFLDELQTAEANRRAAALCGPLINTPFFLAVATRAHASVFKSRGDEPSSYMISIPTQTRKGGASGPLFQNHVSMVFFSAAGDELGDIGLLTRDFSKQHGEFLKDQLGEAFNQMQHLMRPLPPRLYTAFIRFHMKGEINSFYHSITGEFAAGLDTFCGAEIRNAYHVPTVYTPPGTGVFMNTKNGRLTVTVSWREGVLAEHERVLMKEQILADLCG